MTLLSFFVAFVLLAPSAPGQFAHDVRPILSEYCFHCHGPDAGSRKAKLRLDTKDGLFARRDGSAPVVPGRPDASEVLRRVKSRDPRVRMPPASTKRTLSAEQIATVEKWIRDGAQWEGHWAFATPRRPELPPVRDDAWCRNEVDRFVLAKLESHHRKPNERASKRALLRRVSFDLTGLPPTPAELAAFVADWSPRAYEKVVQRLLASPRYGERMAWDWLEAARYADTNGYQGDATRTMWPYRDWVVDALNRNLPYDDFLVWQLAGDLLPDPNFEQRLATAFCRNHMINGEGGRIAEENRVEYVFDQVETVGTVWMGLTLTCARCHDHKFDPLSQRDYYSLSAFFNQTPVTGAGGSPQTPPTLTVRAERDERELARLQAKSDLLGRRLAQRVARITASDGFEAWKTRVRAGVFTPLRPRSATSAAGQEMRIESGGSILVGGRNPPNDTYTVRLELPAGTYRALRLEALRHASMTAGGLARSNSGNFVLTEIEVALHERGRPVQNVAIRDAVATFEQRGHAVRNAFDGRDQTGWAVYRGRPVKQAHTAVFRLASAVRTDGGTLVVTLRHDSKNASHNLGRFRLSGTAERGAGLDDDALVRALQTPGRRRTKRQRDAVALAYAQTKAGYRAARRRRDAARSAVDRYRSRTGKVKVMVMADRPKKRKTFVLRRGIYRQRGAEVEAGVPEFLGVRLPNAPRNRLALARWLTRAEHPLTARVVVNRHWQKFFGTGLVATVEDFGVQGAKPSHPQLLDWLATELVRSGWDIKALHEKIVTSATYRQAAASTPEAYARDPDNRLLARGPRYRLPSFMLRDLALSVSGLIVEKRGGPPVRPYQPEGVWSEATFGKQRYVTDRGDKLYRRSLYTFWRRIIGPTMFFDVAKRQTCEVRTARTNTPMHALLTLNGITYVEAARAMAQRVLRSDATGERARLALAFELATSRPPQSREVEVLARRLASLRRRYAEHPGEAAALLAVGASKRDPSIVPGEHASWTGVCSLILNLDEALNK